MIYTFYSFKGGVGRSMALANVAEWFYRQGLRVVIIDWDLEAPGLENFFISDPQELERVRTQLGLIDLLLSYKRQHANLRLESITSDPISSVTQQTKETRQQILTKVLSVLDEHLPPITYTLYPIHSPKVDVQDDAALWLLPAGWRSGEKERFSIYAHAVQSFNWSEFYTDFHGEAFFEWMRHQLLSKGIADVVLIDSRTGVTEMGGVCTRQMADVIVALCVPNNQNLDGLTDMLRSFKRADVIQARNDRPIDIVAAPTRLDSSELSDLNNFRREFRLKLETPDFVPAAFNQVEAKFWELGIPYIPKYAYHEKLAIGDANRDDHAEQLEKAYINLAVSLTLLAPEGSRLRRHTAHLLRQRYGELLPRVFVAGSANDITRCEMLSESLQKEGISTWNWQRPSSVAKALWQKSDWKDIALLVDQSEYILLYVTDNSIVSWLQQIRYHARRGGKCVLPVSHSSATVDKNKNELRWLAEIRFIDMERDWRELIQQIQQRCQSLPIPFMAPALPQNLVQRTSVYNQLKSFILTKNNLPRKTSVALTGIAGIGKTTIALELCHQPEVQYAFEDGILWVELGPEPNVLGAMNRLFDVLTPGKPQITTIEEGSVQLARLLESRMYLLVLDDLWDASLLPHFYRDNESSCCLVTTRSSMIADHLEQQLEIPPFSPTEAIQAITKRLGQRTSLTNEQLQVFAARVGAMPLGIELAANDVQQRIASGEPIESALGQIGGFSNNTSFVAHQEDIWGLAFFSGDRQVLSASNDATIKMWDLQNQQLVQEFRGHSDGVNSIVVAPDTHSMFSASTDRSIIQWHTNIGKVIARLTGHTASVTNLAISKDGRNLVSSSLDTTLKVWDLQSKRNTLTLSSHILGVNTVAISPDSKYVVSGSADSSVKLWELSNGRVIQTLVGHKNSVTSVAFTSDGRYFLSASADTTIRVWPFQMDSAPRILVGHRTCIWGLAVTINGQLVISASEDGVVNLWSLSSGRVLATHVFGEPLNACTIAPDDSAVLIGGRSGRLYCLGLKVPR